eukprot:CAMPEP_0114567290 /NCGR_PEP_ID=MMETSP0114-20121206/15393_1 /TAXON_ID=31324 /ORGANISM="Goniomonas sp, Strain m" /LENGTH=165 /DNA_ID=CAMNT_0001753851 /DNA_START=316 /DNA_END=810 /DNA_ORIENTATION=+
MGSSAAAVFATLEKVQIQLEEHNQSRERYERQCLKAKLECEAAAGLRIENDILCRSLQLSNDDTRKNLSLALQMSEHEQVLAVILKERDTLQTRLTSELLRFEAEEAGLKGELEESNARHTAHFVEMVTSSRKEHFAEIADLNAQMEQQLRREKRKAELRTCQAA